MLKGVKVTLLGLTFKPDTDDLREAPALDIGRLLIEEGVEVRAYDPQVAVGSVHPLLPKEIDLHSSALDALQGAQAIVLVTEWSEFCELPWEQVARVMISPRLIFDGRNALDGHKLIELGFRYQGVGRSGAQWSD